MCIGLPMRVLSCANGKAEVLREGEQRRVRTALVGDLQPGDWVLVHLDSAVEKLSAERAAEVDAALAMVSGVLAGQAPDLATPQPFSLPSAMSAADLARLTGQR